MTKDIYRDAAISKIYDPLWQRAFCRGAATISDRFRQMHATRGRIRFSACCKIQVLDYPTQQRLLLPLLAHAYALHFAGNHMQTAYHYYLDTQDAAALPDLHATSAGLKALVTQVKK